MFIFNFPLRLIPESKMIYSKGNTKSVRKVAVINPPITTVAKGFCTSAPALVLMAIGRKPSEATVAVINTGLRRAIVPSFTLCRISFIPSFFSWLNVPTSTIPFNTATPNRAIKPMPALMLKGIPLNISAKIPPIALMGIAVNIKVACLKE